MPEKDLSQGEKFQKRRIFRARWHKVLVAMASVVVFCTVYALILPAITMEKGCGLPEHIHGDDCYGLQPVDVLSCVPEVHTHSADCYDEDGELACGQADFLLHTHSENCYGADGSLACTLPEIAEHTHTEECYTLLTHTHGGDCYETTRGELACELEESDGHSHDEDTPVAVLTCTLEEGDDHTHGEDCYELQQPVCELEESEGHTHNDDCYEWEDVPVCELPEEEWVLTCDLPEVEAHSHGENCYDAEGTLVCDKTVVLSHDHTAECFSASQEQVLVCTLAEHTHSDACTGSAYYCGKEPHSHDSECYDAAGELVCTQEAHVHTDACREAPPEETTEVTTEPTEEPVTYYCGQEEHTHGTECYDAAGALTCTQSAHTHTDRCLEKILYCDLQEHTHGDTCFDAEGTLICTLAEHTHGSECFRPTVLTEAELSELLAELTQAVADLDGDDLSASQELLQRLEEAYRQRWLTEEQYLTLYDQVTAQLTQSLEAVAEPCYGTNWLLLRDSGWFNEYSDWGLSVATYSGDFAVAPYAAAAGDTSPSSVQVDNPGGENSADDVTVSKTIKGTDQENVFDITLTVQTPQNINQIITEPDMAVVIVMDISNTMKDNFGDTTRYKAAVDAAEQFLDNFAASNTLGVSKVGYVAFNTDAHKIFDLSPCTNETQADALKNTIRTTTEPIINKNGYGVAKDRFTNIEGGLKMAQDMLAGVSNKNKFIILLTDGFPTTYISNGYTGCDTYDAKIFYDYVLDIGCNGTSYSNTAAIKAREMATEIKKSGITIFSIGVDVAGQTIQKYVEDSEGYATATTYEPFSVVERKDTNYEIGSATDTDAYKNWLQNSIGSGYYYDSTNAAGLKDAYTSIFNQIKTTVSQNAAADWVASDPIPCTSPEGEVEFIGLYDKSNELKSELTGTHEVSAENTASYAIDEATISWNLKQSGYTVSESGGSTLYTYTLKYRVRLQNEDGQFVESKIYNTNGTTTLKYRVVTKVSDNTVLSESKSIDFPIPSIHGYLGELEFKKADNYGKVVADAEFTLHHATTCNMCRGDGSRVEIADQVVTSDADGKVCFEKIPSGHTYTLTETKIPDGYSSDGSHYTVVVAYDEVTVTATDVGNNDKAWNGTIINNTAYELPATGGVGTLPYTLGGATLLCFAAALLYKRKRRREEGITS